MIFLDRPRRIRRMHDRPDLLEHTQRLRTALDTADHAFVDVPLVGAVDGCAYCYSPRDLELLGGDLAAVPDDLVRQFAAEVPEHWTAEQYGLMWRGLAPRILHMAAEQPELMIIPWALRGPSAPQACFHDWPQAQQNALVEAYSALLAASFVTRQPADVIELLGPLAQLHDDVGPWLAQIDEMSGPAADAGFVRLAAHWSNEIASGRQPHWYWYPDNPVGLVTAWLSSPPVLDRLRHFAEQHPGCTNAAGTPSVIEALTTDTEPSWDVVGSLGGCKACII
ncbi:hypothetical protein F4553_001956 [Allocatelliglobosispora scoriae]|uniref:Uncharacterized protein n=1 Tax=Allocatelliglobosispora scoriae TaxID=643052 RepID=A0A841BHK3_9ACTN|nr:hypothetical protein [Allocatelliglobosispora scoriae]MBB5868577.1 hypothetical protein [Allocatelliglobosispora scoriae]